MVVRFSDGTLSRINPSNASSPTVMWTHPTSTRVSSIVVDNGIVWAAGPPVTGGPRTSALAGEAGAARAIKEPLASQPIWWLASSESSARNGQCIFRPSAPSYSSDTTDHG